jgi:hypothetical protein
MATNVLGLKTGEERYVFLYDDVSRPQLLQVLGRFAADPELSFSWRDAAELSCKVRGDEFKQPEPRRPSALARFVNLVNNDWPAVYMVIATGGAIAGFVGAWAFRAAGF